MWGRDDVRFGCWCVYLPCRSDQMMRSRMLAVGLSEKAGKGAVWCRVCVSVKVRLKERRRGW